MFLVRNFRRNYFRSQIVKHKMVIKKDHKIMVIINCVLCSTKYCMYILVYVIILFEPIRIITPINEKKEMIP